MTIKHNNKEYTLEMVSPELFTELSKENQRLKNLIGKYESVLSENDSRLKALIYKLKEVEKEINSVI